MVLRIKRLLYDEGFTIAGARRHLREQSGAGENDGGAGAAGGAGGVGGGGLAGDGAAQLLSRKMLLDLRDTLRAFLTLLERK